jgi:voltage-gated potassium channel
MADTHLIKQFIHFIKQENLHRLLLILFVLLILSSLALAVFEPNISIVNAFWLSIVTLTTVGYGDITPTTLGGRIVGMVIMLFGIGVLGMFTASIASIFVAKRLKEDRGMQTRSFDDHIIICTWNSSAKEIIQELRSDSRFGETPIVLLADLDIKPVDDENLFFLKGAATEENLRRANIEKAKTVIILGDDNLVPDTRDAKVVLAALAVEALNRDAYSIVELADEENVQHCKRANADEIIVTTEFSCRLISRAALDHGITKIISSLLSSREGDDIYKINVPETCIGKNFIDIFVKFKKENNSIVLGIQKTDGTVIENPAADHLLDKDDHLILIATGKPDFQ